MVVDLFSIRYTHAHSWPGRHKHACMQLTRSFFSFVYIEISVAAATAKPTESLTVGWHFPIQEEDGWVDGRTDGRTGGSSWREMKNQMSFSCLASKLLSAYLSKNTVYSWQCNRVDWLTAGPTVPNPIKDCLIRREWRWFAAVLPFKWDDVEILFSSHWKLWTALFGINTLSLSLQISTFSSSRSLKSPKHGKSNTLFTQSKATCRHIPYKAIKRLLKLVLSRNFTPTNAVIGIYMNNKFSLGRRCWNFWRKT